MKKVYTVIFILFFIGFIDSLYLTKEHFSNTLPPCTVSFLADCGTVLRSKYALIFGVPVAVIGVFHYGIGTLTSLFLLLKNKKLARYILVTLSYVGLAASLYFVILMLVVIKAICTYCFLSALVSFILFYIINSTFKEERNRLFILKISFLYKNILKYLLFLFDPEKVHESMTAFGEILGKSIFVKSISKSFLVKRDSVLEQKIAGINFNSPVGLAAGFDYQAQLHQILPSIGFGFGTIGTVTNIPYKGNPSPRLGRLPRSRSLMVNKGFKTVGTNAIVKKLKSVTFEYPVGISIGRSNSSKLKTQKKSIDDIVESFNIFEKANIKHSYYELNISCPNIIHGNISFYPKENLEKLLSAVDRLKLKRPVFVKMPIEKTDKETLQMLKVIAKHSPVGVIFGNLQKDRNHPSLDKSEVAKFETGNFSGKPTYERSNELIKLAYKHYRERFIIIGCGGVFSSRDAYEKIASGATLVQLITGMIFEGPQLPAQINYWLLDILKEKGFKNISEAVGISVKK